MRTVGGLDLARRADFSALVTLAVDARQATVTRALRLPQRPYASQIAGLIAPILARSRPSRLRRRRRRRCRRRAAAGGRDPGPHRRRRRRLAAERPLAYRQGAPDRRPPAPRPRRAARRAAGVPGRGRAAGRDAGVRLEPDATRRPPRSPAWPRRSRARGGARRVRGAAGVRSGRLSLKRQDGATETPPPSPPSPSSASRAASRRLAVQLPHGDDDRTRRVTSCRSPTITATTKGVTSVSTTALSRILDSAAQDFGAIDGSWKGTGTA